ncbi:hypothetical protein VNO78_21165 [Psophocarpus tetragonolobus]|uniref:Myb/SANT-like domain-containing protein n=1 Tax=Psophocarpus tetragonolobus TaxID=3891 RepID=A0AAN9SAP4_PSOTE
MHPNTQLGFHHFPFINVPFGDIVWDIQIDAFLNDPLLWVPCLAAKIQTFHCGVCIKFLLSNVMGDDSFLSSYNLRANWTPSQDRYFLDLMLSRVQKGNKSGKMFSRQAWIDMIEQFNTNFGFKHDVEVLKNRYKRFKKQYSEIKMIVSQKRFQWDETLSMIMADDKAWDECIKAHHDAQSFKTMVIPYYHDLCIIFGHAVADGRFSLSCFDVDFEYEEKDLDDKAITGEGVDDQTPVAVTNKGKVDWSPMMDQFFVELMVDQLRKGNKINRTFRRQAWVDMTESFNNRFGCHCGKVVLKNRFNLLRRHYCSINVLLGKEGFSWDKAQHKVVADEPVWQKCIRVHHNFRLYKIKSMPFYCGMCIVYRNEVTAVCKSNLEKGSSGGNNFVLDTQPLPNNEVTVGCKPNLGKGSSGGIDSITDTQQLSNADKEALHIAGENNLETQPPPSADKALHISSEKNSSRETQSLANVDNKALQHIGENVSDHLKRHHPMTPPTLNESEKARDHMPIAVTSLTKKAKREDNFSVDNVIRVLQAIPDLDDDLILDACDFLEDERRGRIFLALAPHLRKKWLLRKLRLQ